MGNWKLEVFKMGVYMSFPVGLFYYFNQPQFFEGWMMKKRAELFPTPDVRVKESIDKGIVQMEEKREEQWKAQMKTS